MIYGIEDMVRGDCLFAATGVTTGSLLSGVKFRKDVIETETVVMRSVTGTVRYIKAEHRQLDKFHWIDDGRHSGACEARTLMCNCTSENPSSTELDANGFRVRATRAPE